MKLGTRCKDTVSGFTGVAVAAHNYLNGCTRITIQPPVDKDGKLPESQTFDEPQLEAIGTAVPDGDKSTGGPEKYSDSRVY